MKQKPLSRIILFGTPALLFGAFLLHGMFGVVEPPSASVLVAQTTSSQSSSKASSQAASCGDGTIDPKEECDDAVLNGKGGCSEQCKRLFCGDGTLTLELKEECEPVKTGSNFSTPSCGTYCSPPECKETKTTTGAITTTCSGGCRWTFQDRCPAEVTLVTEEMLKKIKAKSVSSASASFALSIATASGAVQAAKDALAPSLCGNAKVDPNEDCDNAENNSDVTANACRTSCTFPVCGDGIIDALFGETCDDGDGNSNTTPDACRRTCSPPICGDGIVDSGEECDAKTDCTEQCTFTAQPAHVCGNGIMEESEQCDDGNIIDADGCSALCVIEESICGDGVLDVDETCDDQNLLDGDGCSSLCAVEVATCGNGNIDAGEECDDGVRNADTEPGRCRTTCTSPRCGDAILDTEEECDDGNNLSTDDCTVSCELPICGDGFLQQGEECDPREENQNGKNTCSTLCKPIDEQDEGSNNVIIMVFLISSIFGTIAGITIGMRWMAVRKIF